MENFNSYQALVEVLKTAHITDERWKNIIKGFIQPSFNTSPNGCEHSRQSGSEYGLSCIDCGTELLGFGKANTSEVCVNHQFHVVTNEEYHPIGTFCIYCRASWEIPNLLKPISTNLN